MRRSHSKRDRRKGFPSLRRYFAFVESLERRELLTVAPYVIPSAPNVSIETILTVGDAVPETDAATDLFDGTPGWHR